MPEYYFERVNQMLEHSRCYGFPKNGDRLLEIGTGWLHWEAITSRLFFDIQATLIDAWDNRQLRGIKNYLSQLQFQFDKLDGSSKQVRRARRQISEIMEVESFDDLYKLLCFNYIVDDSGKLGHLKESSFDVVVSAGVLEHIDTDVVSEFVKGIATALKPGGYSYHSINLRDHLYFYDRSVSTKQYLRYSNPKWKRYFENDVQYFNRIQYSEWHEIFNKAGLVLVEEEIQKEELSGLKIAEEFKKCDSRNLNCVGLRIIHRKQR